MLVILIGQSVGIRALGREVSSREELINTSTARNVCFIEVSEIIAWEYHLLNLLLASSETVAEFVCMVGEEATEKKEK